MTDYMENEGKIPQAEFDGNYFFAFLFKKRWFIIIFSGIITIASVIYSFNTDVYFKSTVNAVQPRSMDGGMEGMLGSLSSTLKDFGLTKLGGGGGNETYTFMVIMQSRSVIDSMIAEFNLPEVYDIPDSTMDLVRKEFTGNLMVELMKDGNYLISIWDQSPERASIMANKFVEFANLEAERIFREEIRLGREQLERRLDVTDSTIAGLTDTLETFSRKNLIFSPEDQMKTIGQSIAEMKALEINYEIMYEYYKNVYGADDPEAESIKKLLEQTRQQMTQAKNEPGYLGNFTLYEASEVGIEYMRIYTELEAYFKVKTFLVPMVEKARLDEERSVKSLIVLDEAIPAEKKDKPKRAFIVLGAAAGSSVLAIFILLVYNSYRSFRRKYNTLKGDL